MIQITREHRNVSTEAFDTDTGRRIGYSINQSEYGYLITTYDRPGLLYSREWALVAVSDTFDSRTSAQAWIDQEVTG